MIQLTDEMLRGWLAELLLPTFRILALFTVAPLLSQRAVPVRLRVAAGIVFAIAAAPLARIPSTALGPDSPLIGLIANEVLVGLTIGLMARILFAAFEVAGETIGLQMGLSFAGFFDPQSGATNPAARFLNMSALTCFIVMDGPGMLLAATVQSYASIPVSVDFAWLAARNPLELGSRLFEIAFSVALPFMTLLLFVNLALGVMSRIGPQFSVFAIGFPITVGIGLVLLAMSFPLLLSGIEQAFGALGTAITG
ncbi:MAG: flagellar biosynthetic protein FliR [Burkholderiaceae bacterium]